MCDKVFASVTDVVPCFVIEGKSTSTDFLHDFLVALAVEWRLTTQQDVANYPTTPDIALFSVVLVQNFRCNIVWGAELFIQLLVWVIDKRGSKVNNLDLIELFVLLKQDILWLEISVDNLVLMAVVDTGKYLFH